MVYLNRIYTKTGDAGETSLGDGARVPKTHPRIAAYGGVDELNSVIGVALTVDGLDEPVASKLREIQNDLFDVGADLCMPETDAERTAREQAADPGAAGQSAEHRPLRVTPQQVEKLEHWIDAANEHLEPLTSFVLPGGTTAAAHLHLARAVCRRVELGVLRLAESEPVNPQVVVYLNRLSDLLFVLARLANADGEADVLWTPGKGRGDS